MFILYLSCLSSSGILWVVNYWTVQATQILRQATSKRNLTTTISQVKQNCRRRKRLKWHSILYIRTFKKLCPQEGSTYYKAWCRQTAIVTTRSLPLFLLIVPRMQTWRTFCLIIRRYESTYYCTHEQTRITENKVVFVPKTHEVLYCAITSTWEKCGWTGNGNGCHIISPRFARYKTLVSAVLW